MIFTRNNVEVTKEGYAEDRVYLLDKGVYAQKLSIQLLSAPPNEPKNFKYGPAIIQITEREEHTFEDELNTEQWLELGFNSRGFATAITGFRIRTPSITEIDIVKPALFHCVLYG